MFKQSYVDSLQTLLDTYIHQIIHNNKKNARNSMVRLGKVYVYLLRLHTVPNNGLATMETWSTGVEKENSMMVGEERRRDTDSTH